MGLSMTWCQALEEAKEFHQLEANLQVYFIASCWKIGLLRKLSYSKLWAGSEDQASLYVYTSTLSPGDPVSGRDQVRTAGYGEVDSGSGRHSSPGSLWEKNHLNLSLTSSSAANLVWLQLWLAASSFDDSTYARAGIFVLIWEQETRRSIIV